MNHNAGKEKLREREREREKILNQSGLMYLMSLFPRLGDHAVTRKDTPNECMHLTYHTHCAKRPGFLTACFRKNQSIGYKRRGTAGAIFQYCIYRGIKH